MIWLDYFLQLFLGALAWCLAVPVAIGLVVVGIKAYVAVVDWMARPRVLKARRSPFSGGLS